MTEDNGVTITKDGYVFNFRRAGELLVDNIKDVIVESEIVEIPVETDDPTVVEEETVYVVLSSEPSDWGTGTYYTRSGEQEPYTFTEVEFEGTVSPAFATDTYYKLEGTKYVLLDEEPNDWGTGTTTYYKEKEVV